MELTFLHIIYDYNDINPIMIYGTGLPLPLISSGVCGPLSKPGFPRLNLDTW